MAFLKPCLIGNFCHGNHCNVEIHPQNVTHHSKNENHKSYQYSNHFCKSKCLLSELILVFAIKSIVVYFSTYLHKHTGTHKQNFYRAFVSKPIRMQEGQNLKSVHLFSVTLYLIQCSSLNWQIPFTPFTCYWHLE